MSEGTEAMQKYFSQLKGGGNKNAIQERRTIAIDDNAALVTGFYEFIPILIKSDRRLPNRGRQWT